MSFLVQSDAGDVVGANALISVEYFVGYHSDRGNTLGAKTDTEIQGAIVKATDFVASRWRYKGTPISADTAFPRDEIYDSSGNLVEGIPSAIQKAVAEYGLFVLNGGNLSLNPTLDESGRVVSKIRKEVVGAVVKDVTYATNLGQQTQSIPAADTILKSSGLLSGTSKRCDRI